MAADNQPDPAVDLLAQLRGALEQLNAVAARVPGVAQATAHLPNLPSIPAPARITAAQISSGGVGTTGTTDSIATCPAGTVAFGGGAVITQGDGTTGNRAALYISSTVQTSGTPTSWRSNAVVVRAGGGGGAITYQSYIICSVP